MSHDPMSPQGVNMYAGFSDDRCFVDSIRSWNQGGGFLGILLDHIPPEIEEAIIERIEDQTRL